jgi:hypothetical protein
MPNTTSFEYGDVVLVPFPFTNQSTSKKLCAKVTNPSQECSQPRAAPRLTDIRAGWRACGTARASRGFPRQRARWRESEGGCLVPPSLTRKRRPDREQSYGLGVSPKVGRTRRERAGFRP